MTDRPIPVRNTAGSIVHARPRRRSPWFVPILLAFVLGVVALFGARSRTLRSGTGDRVAGSDTGSPRKRYLAQTSLAPILSLPPAKRPITAPPAARRGKRIERLAQLQKTRAEHEKLWDAEQAGIAACMAERGFDYGRLPYDDSSDMEYERTRVEPSDPAAAREHGYGLVRDMQDAALRQQEEAARGGPYVTPGPPVSAAYREALMGPDMPLGQAPESEWDSVEIPGGGKISWYRDSCLSRAREAVYGEDYAALVLDLAMTSLESDIAAELPHDATYQAGLERWRGCMAGRGYAYAEPRAAMRALAEAFHEGRMGIDELRKVEVDVAVADSTCYQAAGLTELLAAGRERAEQSVLARAQDKAQALRNALDDAVVRAETLLDRAPASGIAR